MCSLVDLSQSLQAWHMFVSLNLSCLILSLVPTVCETGVGPTLVGKTDCGIWGFGSPVSCSVRALNGVQCAGGFKSGST